MEKRTYIQPVMETMVLPKGVLMDDVQAASGGSFPTDLPPNPAPKHRTEVF